MKNPLKVLILAGWSGTRLWPLSRKFYPKQFLKLQEFWGVSFFEDTMNRALKLTSKEYIFVLTNQDYKYHVINQSGLREENIIIESEAKNTLGAIMLGIENAQEEDVFLVLSSDAVIEDDWTFKEIVTNSISATNDHIVIFWVKPTKPHTGYGYIQFENESEHGTRKVISFKEKPNEILAKDYIKEGYYWNVWMFLFSKKVLLRELEKSNREYFDLIHSWVRQNFSKLPDLSIDYGILEQSNAIKIALLNCYWNDLWSFDAFDEHLHRKTFKNPNVFSLESWNFFVLSENREKITTLIGVSDLIVIDTPDALLITKKGESQKVKNLLKELETNQKHDQLQYGTTVYRPWGSYTIIDEGVWFKTKRITVLPGKKLSSQLHHKRSEHWVVVSGQAKVTIAEKEMILSKGESTFIPVETKHRLENIWTEDLHIIESQIGDYLGEDDIVRFDDLYGRN